MGTNGQLFFFITIVKTILSLGNQEQHSFKLLIQDFLKEQCFFFLILLQ